MSWLFTILVILVAALLLFYAANVIYDVYRELEIEPHFLTRLEASFLSILGTWLPWVFALLIVAALWYTAKKET